MCKGCDNNHTLSNALAAIKHGAMGLAKAIMGVDPAPRAVVERRRAICGGCEFAIPCTTQAGKKCMCSKCGCILAAKTLIASEHCPVGKWLEANNHSETNK